MGNNFYLIKAVVSRELFYFIHLPVECLLKGAGAELEQGRGVALPCPFPKIRKNCPNVWEKCPDCGHLWVKFLI